MSEQSLNRVARVDRWRCRMDAGLNTDSRGFVRIWGTVITADSVLEYGPLDGHPDGHLEFVPESTVFDDAALETLRNAPVTFLHPAEPVSADNSVRLTVGHIVDVKRDGGRLRALHQIEDAQTIEKIRGGVIELSPGYTTQLDDADGLVVDGREVHAIQSNRVYNHNAIVPEARAGHDNALTIDASVLPADGLRIQKTGKIMAEYTKEDGTKVEVDADLLADIQSKLTKAAGTKGDENGEEEPDEEEESSDDKDDKAEDDAKPDDPPTPATDAKPLTVADVERIKSDALGEFRQSLKAEQAALNRTSQIHNDARQSLPINFSFEKKDGKPKSDDEVMRAAIAERSPDMAGRAKAMKGDALYGFFQGIITAPAESQRVDASTVTAPRTSYADALANRDIRTDAIASCGLTGDAAVSQKNISKLQLTGTE